MKIPKTNTEREAFYTDIIEKAFQFRNDRKARYSILKNYFLFGNSSEQETVDYNKLYPHIDLLASFLFSGETTAFVIEASASTDGQEPELEMEKASKLVPHVNDIWNDSNLDIVFNDALTWALVYDTSFIKLVPTGGKEFAAYTVDPLCIGVLREDIPSLDMQPAVVHEFYISKTDFENRIAHLSPTEQDRAREAATFDEKIEQYDTLPMPVQKLLITSTSPNMQGNITEIDAQWDYNAKITEPVCTAHEVWVYDADKKDYVVATMIGGQYLLFECENPFVKNELPFIKICPNQIYNYFWGRSELMYLIPLQEWLNQRIAQIRTLLARQANPSGSAFGLTGFNEEKWQAYRTPGGFYADAMPNGKIEESSPDVPDDLFKELSMIENMFSEVSGIRDLMQGKGDSGVRAMSHANLLVRVGSSRVKKKASVLEDAVEKVGHLILKMMQKYDNTQYKTEKGTSFIAAQLSGKCMVKVDSHSNSPIFIETQLEKAQLLFQAGAIDEEDLIDAVRPQNIQYIKSKLKKRKVAQAEAAKAQAMEEAKSGEK